MPTGDPRGFAPTERCSRNRGSRSLSSGRLKAGPVGREADDPKAGKRAPSELRARAPKGPSRLTRDALCKTLAFIIDSDGAFVSDDFLPGRATRHIYRRSQ